jgi:1-acyl-sn-glycerol-3-phosphate acyltransferase
MRQVMNAMVRLLARFLVRVHVVGLENVPKNTSLIVMMNHINFLDGPLILSIIPRDILIMTKYETFHDPVLGPLARLYGAFPVRRGEVDRQALREAEKVLTEGKALLYSPEGHRSGHGRLQRARAGLAYLALRTDAPILPVAITGIELFRSNIVRLRRTDAYVTIGKPFHFVKAAELTPHELRQELTAQAMYQLAKLMPEHYRGFYQDVSQASDKHVRFDPTDARSTGSSAAIKM